ncbi:MAG: S-methyl-5-thioribose-1-phosphate isomerase [Nitrososphaerota archaeon]|jgi:ribose 1,5-bisphosphate isomerase|nr:S-methyl-5-thioribose-1-phosphate isomerase [Nitrososphaerota archaeon]
MEVISVVADKIRCLEIKGARNAAVEAVKALQEFAQQSRAEDKTKFLEELTQAQQLLFNSRETEPLLRNAVYYLIGQIRQSSIKNVSELCTLLNMRATHFLGELDVSRNCAAEIGAKCIQNGMTIFTHCHSSTAILMLLKAKQDGKNFKVICTETRPALQGRLTACEMAENSIDTTFIVDSASRAFISKADFIIVGADAITPKGNVVNKIGTSGLAVLAYDAHKPFYVVSELLKFDTTTHYNEFENVEQRNPADVWKDAPQKIAVQNPAFDVTPCRYITNIICEKGVISPQKIFEITHQFYSWLFT